MTLIRLAVLFCIAGFLIFDLAPRPRAGNSAS